MADVTYADALAALRAECGEPTYEREAGGSHDAMWGSVVAASVEVEWIRRTATFAGEAVGLVWREFRTVVEWEAITAKRSGAGIRRPERRAAAYQRIMRATAALTAARAVEAGE